MNHAWVDDLEQSFNRSMKLDEEEEPTSEGPAGEGLPLAFDVSMNSALSQPLTWSFTSLELPEAGSNPLGPTHDAQQWHPTPDLPASGIRRYAYYELALICHVKYTSKF